MSLQNHPNIIKELFVYFSRFPNRDNVLKRFRKREQDVDDAFKAYYTDLKNQIEALTEYSICPAIDDLVFTSSEDYLKKQIEDMDGRVFLLLDYGDINRNEVGPTKRKTDVFNMAITVGMQYNPDDMDSAEHAALSDYTLNALRCVVSQMQQDNATCSGSSIKLVFPHQFVPFYARTLQNTTGWTLPFSRQEIDLI